MIPHAICDYNGWQQLCHFFFIIAGRIAVTSSPLEQTQSEDTVYIEYLIIVDYRNFEK